MAKPRFVIVHQTTTCRGPMSQAVDLPAGTYPVVEPDENPGLGVYGPCSLPVRIDAGDPNVTVSNAAHVAIIQIGQSSSRLLILDDHRRGPSLNLVWGGSDGNGNDSPRDRADVLLAQNGYRRTGNWTQTREGDIAPVEAVGDTHECSCWWSGEYIEQVDYWCKEIVKAAKDRDLYLIWSSVVDAPIYIGCRADLLDQLWHEHRREHPNTTPNPGYGPEDRIRRADQTGTSMTDCDRYGWDCGSLSVVAGAPTDGHRYHIRRDRLAAYAEALLRDDEAAAMALLERSEDT